MTRVYDNVIVPFDGSQPARAALAPAADLAWRCGARVVIVNNSEVSDTASRAALKTRAMSMSGADIDYWVDVDRDLGEALLAATRYRQRPILCLAMKSKPGLRKRFNLSPVTEHVFRRTEVPVLAIGPNADVSRGLPLAELVVSLDGSANSEEILRIVTDWARSFKARVILVGVVSETTPGPHTGEIEYLEAHARALRSQVPDASYELIAASDPITGLVNFVDARDDAVLCMSTHGRTGNPGPLGSVAFGVLGRSTRAVLYVRPLR